MVQHYSVFLGMTDSVAEMLMDWPHEEMMLAFWAGGAVASFILAEHAAGRETAPQYTGSVNDICITAYPVFRGSKLYVTIASIYIDGDWDPDGGERVDALAFAPKQTVAEACATRLGRRLTFCQLSGWPIPYFDETFVIEDVDRGQPRQRKGQIPETSPRDGHDVRLPPHHGRHISSWAIAPIKTDMNPAHASYANKNRNFIVFSIELSAPPDRQGERGRGGGSGLSYPMRLCVAQRALTGSQQFQRGWPTILSHRVEIDNSAR